MTTLHIEHAITDFGTWSAAFDVSRTSERNQVSGRSASSNRSTTPSTSSSTSTSTASKTPPFLGFGKPRVVLDGELSRPRGKAPTMILRSALA